MKTQAKVLMYVTVVLLCGGISNAAIKKGYICLESEGAEIHFRNIRVMELPAGITNAESTAPVVGDKQ